MPHDCSTGCTHPACFHCTSVLQVHCANPRFILHNCKAPWYLESLDIGICKTTVELRISETLPPFFDGTYM